MAKHLCHNITSADENNYSAPVPIIGLYIAGASLACFHLMISDVIHGFRHRKLWLPCRWFSLNSVILTLLSIAAKVPVDLTTPMPSSLDQLSKLTGTAFICVSMGFLLPSLGSNSASECVTNMFALSILVITIIVNMCLQISTGVIFSFIPEHVVIIFGMLVMLSTLWISTSAITMRKETLMDLNRGVFRDGKGGTTMLERLKLCYLHGYNVDPQVLLHRYAPSIYANTVCFLGSIVVLEVLLRTLFSYDFSSCSEVSSYGWSVRIIVSTQLLVILLASLTSNFRVVITTDQLEVNFKLDHEATDGVTDNKPYLHSYDEGYKFACTDWVVSGGIVIAIPIIILPTFVVMSINSILGCFFDTLGCFFDRKISIGCCLKSKNAQPQKGIEEYSHLLSENSRLFTENNIKIENQTLTRCVDDIKKWTSVEAKRNSLYNLKELLSKSPSAIWFSFKELHWFLYQLLLVII